jgi:hypothetical protein
MSCWVTCEACAPKAARARTAGATNLAMVFMV